MTSIALPILGLAGDQNPSAAPKGAMSEADNVVCDLPGQARPRPNHEVVYSNGAAVSKCDALFSFNGEWLAHDATGGWRNSVGLLTGATNGSVDSSQEPQAAVARGSMYVTTSANLQRVGSPAATSIVKAGMDVALSPAWPNVPNFTTAYTGPFTAPVSVAYRAVIKRKDENGYVKRSPPTGAFTVRDSATMANNAFIIAGTAGDEKWYVEAGGLLAGDEVEFYRTKSVASATAAIPPDFYLVKSHVVTSAEASANAIATDIIDDVSDDNLGEALYTNPAQGGALSSKYNPPMAARVAAFWNRCLWLGAVRDPAQLPLTITLSGENEDVTSANTNPLRLGTRYIVSGTIASGLTTITGIGTVTGLVAGMYITDDDSNGPLFSPAIGVIPTGTKIQSISGAGPYTITMTAAATGNLTINNTTNKVECCDVITVDGNDFVCHAASTSYTIPKQFSPSHVGNRSEADVAVRLANAINLLSATVPGTDLRAIAIADTGTAVGSGAVGRVLITATDGDDFSWATTRPSALTPTLSSSTATQDRTFVTKLNRIAWSAADEPEAWPLLNYVDLGDDRTEVQRIVPLRDALLVFTTTGLFRVTGTPPGNWSVDLLDASLRLVRAECVDVLDGVAFALTNRGVAMVTEAGVSRVVSDGKVEEDIAPTIKLCLDDPTQRGARVMCWEREALVLVALPTVPVTETSPCSSEVLCYAPKTGSWTRWPDQYWYAGASNGISGYPYVAATRPDQLPLYEIRQFVEPRGYDNDWTAIAVTSGAGTTSLVISDAARGSWYPRSGDWLLVGTAPNVWRRVTGVVDGGATWTLTLDTASPSPLATFTAYEGAPVLLEWLPSAMGANEPFMVGTWREAVFSFYGGPADSGEVKDANARIVFGVRHDGTDTPVELVGTPARSIVQLRPYRFGWPRNASRRGVCFPRLSFSEIDWLPRISGVLLVGDAVSERVRR